MSVQSNLHDTPIYAGNSPAARERGCGALLQGEEPRGDPCGCALLEAPQGIPALCSGMTKMGNERGLELGAENLQGARSRSP